MYTGAQDLRPVALLVEFSKLCLGAWHTIRDRRAYIRYELSTTHAFETCCDLPMTRSVPIH